MTDDNFSAPGDSAMRGEGEASRDNVPNHITPATAKEKPADIFEIVDEIASTQFAADQVQATAAVAAAAHAAVAAVGADLNPEQALQRSLYLAEIKSALESESRRLEGRIARRRRQGSRAGGRSRSRRSWPRRESSPPAPPGLANNIRHYSDCDLRLRLKSGSNRRRPPRSRRGFDRRHLKRGGIGVGGGGGGGGSGATRTAPVSPVNDVRAGGVEVASASQAAAALCAGEVAALTAEQRLTATGGGVAASDLSAGGISDHHCLFIDGLILDPKKLFGKDQLSLTSSVRATSPMIAREDTQGCPKK